MTFTIEGSVKEILAPLEALSSVSGRQALARALNHTANKARTQVSRALVKQTGLRYGGVTKALSNVSANATTLAAGIVAKGPYLLLSDFNARRTKAGISAAPWGKRQIFAGTFLIKKYKNQVYKRVGKDRFPIKKLYGPAIPKEMVKEESKTAFENTVEEALGARVAHELKRLMGG